MTVSISHLTALYSPLDLKYAQEMSGPYEDLSFHSDECQIIASLKDNHITGFWRPMVAVGDDGLLKLQIERLYGICRNITYMDFLTDGLSVISKFLLEQGYTARPYYTQVIDLTKSREQLHSEIRKSYKSLVNKDVIMSTMSDIGPYRKLHENVRGTRSSESWFIQQRMIWGREAFCLLQSEVINPAVAHSLTGGLFYYNKNCYYASGCSLEGVGSHAVIWNAILHAKELGCKTFEMGEQVFSGQKMMGISKFKAGFGGRTITRLILERKK